MILAKHFRLGKQGKRNHRSAYSHKRISKQNPTETLFDEELEAVGWKSMKNGWPDRLIYNPYSDEACFVEIKNSLDTIQPNQRRMHKLLEKLGLKVVVIQFNPTEKNAGLRLRKVLYKLTGQAS